MEPYLTLTVSAIIIMVEIFAMCVLGMLPESVSVA